MYGPSCSSAGQNIEDQNAQPFKSKYFETLDILIAELQRRFSDNDDLLNSIASLDELDVDKMMPLKNLGKFTKIKKLKMLLVIYLCPIDNFNNFFRFNNSITRRGCCSQRLFESS